MAFRLFTADGKIRVFQTHKQVGGGEYSPPKYVTSCGMEWKTEPKPYETCDHIDCAIEVQRSSSNEKGALIILPSLVIGYMLLELVKRGDLIAPPIVGIIIFAGFLILIYNFKDDEKLGQLNEYVFSGTIDGMRAYIDSSFDELTELDNAEDCVNYGFIQYNKRKYNDAIKAFDKAIKLNPRSAAAWNSKGIALKAVTTPTNKLAGI